MFMAAWSAAQTAELGCEWSVMRSFKVACGMTFQG
jgi:hypothetical protein